MSLTGVCGALMVGAGFVIGMHVLGDNSFLTHLATGRIIVDSHHVPSHDPFSFSALGHPWVVQSWLASLAYGVLDDAGGLRWIMVYTGILSAILAGLVWTLTRPAGRVLPRLGIATVVLVIGASFWGERPLLVALVALGLVLLSVEGRLDPRWLVAVMWVWVNVHGSFPLGLIAIAAFAIGRRLDGEQPTVELAALKWAVVGTLLGAINPVGPKLLFFPIALLSKYDVLKLVSEWQSPRFTSTAERMFLLEIILVVVALVRRPSWRATIPAIVFIPAALLGVRNVTIASIVVIPGLARGLADLGSLEGDERRPVFAPAAAVILAAAVLVGTAKLSDPESKINDTYPVKAVDFTERAGLTGAGRHVVAQDFVGNYLEERLGPRANVFIDDRFDMYPDQITTDYLLLLYVISWPAETGGGSFSQLLRYLSLPEHFATMVRGLISTKDIIYFLSVIAVALFLTQRSVESVRWR